mmetsp:Transcript_18236/g.24667  ORF Transcript_18236/g.24667 Transcript_18236/m.24667 type:complete len:392 (-) Transcript_18236:262-1437(-)|eukprot:CAMPEP_0185776540 /NCGR_PEP_ID=MMETSP1174-20130828/86029_1 /TAXON_ID=35687 /ORGANISM="Dictyocha speculum, Strain CCMP1381" /LENGTH=391 /DNA_ID=CAMNT_0028464537 /DNA_START=12 /DNA_END=1187 /DNA_ORIENTATION=-
MRNFLWFCLPMAASLAGDMTALKPSSTLWKGCRSDALTLLNHPLQIQLAQGTLPLGSFRRLVRDRKVIIEGMFAATNAIGNSRGNENADSADDHDFRAFVAEIRGEAARADTDAEEWLVTAEAAGKTIAAPAGVTCWTCGGAHLNIDCPEDTTRASSMAVSLASILTPLPTRDGPADASALAGVAAVLRGYGWACGRISTALLEVDDPATPPLGMAAEDASGSISTCCYSGWLTAHAARWSRLADMAESLLDTAASDSTSDVTTATEDAVVSLCRPSYAAALAMLLGFIDAEASVAGLVDSPTAAGSSLADARSRIDAIEPGFLATQDRHAAFVRDMGTVGSEPPPLSEGGQARGGGGGGDTAELSPAEKKVAAAAAYLAARKAKDKGNGK